MPSDAPTFLARRATLRALTAAASAGALASLAGCGFALRQTPSFGFESVQFKGLENTPISRALQRAMQSAGLRVVTGAPAAPAQQEAASAPSVAQPAQVVLHVLTDQNERVVSGQNASGQVRELTLRTRFKFNLGSAVGRALLGETELLLERDITFSETAALAKAAEEAMLFRDMENDLVQQVLRRLAAVRLS